MWGKLQGWTTAGYWMFIEWLLNVNKRDFCSFVLLFPCPFVSVIVRNSMETKQQQKRWTSNREIFTQKKKLYEFAKIVSNSFDDTKVKRIAQKYKKWERWILFLLTLNGKMTRNMICFSAQWKHSFISLFFMLFEWIWVRNTFSILLWINWIHLFIYREISIRNIGIYRNIEIYRNIRENIHANLQKYQLLSFCLWYFNKNNRNRGWFTGELEWFTGEFEWKVLLLNDWNERIPLDWLWMKDYPMSLLEYLIYVNDSSLDKC